MSLQLKVGDWVVVKNDLSRIPFLVLCIERGKAFGSFDRIMYVDLAGKVSFIGSNGLRYASPQEIAAIVEQDGIPIQS